MRCLKFFAPFSALLFLSCAGGYAPPTANVTTFTYDIPLHKDALFTKAAGALKQLGYTLSVEDYDAGQIRTTLRIISARQEECDCGTWYNTPFTGDRATSVKVEWLLSIREGGIDFDTRYVGEHLNTARNVDRRLECISTGVYEKQIVDALVTWKP
ncbi:MAG: hypothetical protein V1913_12975 [Fibrobacterota bacterium]